MYVTLSLRNLVEQSDCVWKIFMIYQQQQLWWLKYLDMPTCAGSDEARHGEAERNFRCEQEGALEYLKPAIVSSC